MDFFGKASRIALDNVERIDSYTRFRKEFDLPEQPESAEITLSAESEYVLFINGIRVKATQFSDFPNRKTVSLVDVAPLLKKGRNCIAVLVFRLGYSCLTHLPCAPGLVLRLKWNNGEILSDRSWKGSFSPAFRQGKKELVTGQLGVTFEFDARKEDDWKEVGYDDSLWQNAAELPLPAENGDWAQFEARPIPFLEERPLTETKIVMQGDFFAAKDGMSNFFRARMPWDALDATESNVPGLFARPGIPLVPGGEGVAFKDAQDDADGVYAVMDIGQETEGFLYLELSAPAGTLVEIHHGEHRDDGTVRSRISGRCFIDRYICKEGENTFSYPIRRIGARYLQLCIYTKDPAKIRIRYCGLSETVVPLPEPAAFLSDDRLNVPVRNTAIRTLMTCMHDHYEDCPWREQALYAYDSRNQILYGYYVWGNYDFVQASLELLGRSYAGNGYLNLTAPGKGSRAIACFTMVWILELQEFLLYSGRTEFFRKHATLVEEILTLALDRKSKEKEGLLIPGERKDIWNFYEWTGNLGDTTEQDVALYNLYLMQAFRACGTMYRMTGNEERAAFWEEHALALGRRVKEVFANREDGLWSESLTPDPKPYEHVQAMMIRMGLTSEAETRHAAEAIMSGSLIPVTYSALPYLASALLKAGQEARTYLKQRLMKEFTAPLFHGCTTFPETSFEGDAFTKAGSLCHGWSAIPVWFDGAVHLGITPLEPGFRKFEVKPWPGELRFASGEVPTPAGRIRIRWEKRCDGLAVTLSCPAGTEPVLNCWEEAPVVSFHWETYDPKA